MQVTNRHSTHSSSPERDDRCFSKCDAHQGVGDGARVRQQDLRCFTTGPLVDVFVVCEFDYQDCYAGACGESRVSGREKGIGGWRRGAYKLCSAPKAGCRKRGTA